MSESVDREALLCALALAPSTYSRNRFISLYQDGELRLVRRRAAIVRSLVKLLTRARTEPIVEPMPDSGGIAVFEVTISDPGLCFKRKTRLDTLELALLRYMVARARGVCADLERAQIEATLARLAGPLPASA